MATTSETGNGFTLIELMAVVAIILLLAALLVGAGHGIIARSGSKAAQAQILALTGALEKYKADHRGYPPADASVALFPPDADTETNVSIYSLPLALLSSQYDSGSVDYYTCSLAEVDVNSDGKVNDTDRYNGKLYILDPWGFPVYYYTLGRSITVGGSSVTLYFGANNKNGFDLGSRGPNHLVDMSVSSGIWGIDHPGDDIVNWVTNP
ncbi:MAG: prepilin-type N-terminal cleavage/methylation domain-containing protein [Candidatus Brocadiia bacterium]